MPTDLTKDQIYSIKSFMAFVLRHKPYFYRVKLDNDGFADIHAVLSAINRNKNLDINKDQLIDIVKRFSGGIFAIEGNKVKARSGHTVAYNMRIPEGFVEVTDIPNVLYCLVDKGLVSKIVSEGGIALSGQNVLLTREDPKPMTDKTKLTVHAQKAKAELVRFYAKEDQFFVHHLPSKFLSIHV